MPETKRSRMEISPVHANAAAIDIGGTLHVASVGPDRDPEPVRSFGTFTGDLHRLSISAESAQVAMEPLALLDSRFRDSGAAHARDAKHVAHNGCSVCTSMECCDPAFVRSVGSPHRTAAGVCNLTSCRALRKR
jgi:hypothetical protein